MYDYLIVGAGFAGSVLAERLASDLNKKVLLIDKRNHVGGNAYDYYDNSGILVHKYGPHIFHTNSSQVYEYLSQFTMWRNYQHRVLASVDGQLVPFPINLTTVNTLYGYNLTSDGLLDFFQSKAEKTNEIRTSEDVIVNSIGRDLYKKFFKGYTKKQWNLDPSELHASVTSRIPIRTNKDDRYFTDKFQVMPLYGYTKMFEQIINHPNIHLMLNTSYKDIIGEIKHKKLIYTGPIDEFFDFRFGRLPYRSINFEFKTLDQDFFQCTGTINYPNDYLFTRITEFKHLSGQKHPKTSIVYEFPCSQGEPYYPIPTSANAELYEQYHLLARQMKNTYFAGRLGTYKYYNMDQVVAQALATYKKIQLSELVAIK